MTTRCLRRPWRRSLPLAMTGYMPIPDRWKGCRNGQQVHQLSGIKPMATDPTQPATAGARRLSEYVGNFNSSAVGGTEPRLGGGCAWVGHRDQGGGGVLVQEHEVRR